MRNIYLVLAIAGAIVPWLLFLDFFATEGVAGFLPALFVNGAAGGFAADVLISSAVFWLWLRAERAPRQWLYVAVNLAVGLSCALPLYLYVRAGRGVAMA
jgi:hypothetical protein